MYACTVCVCVIVHGFQALGNHEFDNGASGLAPFLHNATFPVLSCNIDARNDPDINGLFLPSVVLELGGEKVGVVGYTTDETPTLVDQCKLLFAQSSLYIVRALHIYTCTTDMIDYI